MACKLVGMLAVVYLMSCVYSSPLEEQKPLDCPANEVYHKCSLEVCFKKCDDLRHPPPCPNISSDCYLPSCECKDDYLRNSEGVCVTYEECWPCGPMIQRCERLKRIWSHQIHKTLTEVNRGSFRM